MKSADEKLFAALYNQNLEEIKAALEERANVNSRYALDDTPLHIAAKTNQSEAARILLEGGADVNVINAYSFIPLYLAVLYNHVEVALALLKGGANPGYYNYGVTSLHEAAFKGNNVLLQSLLEVLNNPDRVDFNGNTSLHIAAKSGNVEAVTVLLSHNAAPNNQNSLEGEAPLHLAAKGGYTDIVSLLIKAGADLNLRNNKNHTPLYEACIAYKIKVVEQLLDAEARVEESDVRAAALYCPEIVQRLQEALSFIPQASYSDVAIVGSEIEESNIGELIVNNPEEMVP